MAIPNHPVPSFEFSGKVVDGAVALAVGSVIVGEFAPPHSWLRYAAVGALAVAGIVIPTALTRAESRANRILPPHG